MEENFACVKNESFFVPGINKLMGQKKKAKRAQKELHRLVRSKNRNNHLTKILLKILHLWISVKDQY